MSANVSARSSITRYVLHASLVAAKSSIAHTNYAKMLGKLPTKLGVGRNLWMPNFVLPSPHILNDTNLSAEIMLCY